MPKAYLDKLAVENPGINLAGMYRKAKRDFPLLFKRTEAFQGDALKCPNPTRGFELIQQLLDEASSLQTQYPPDVAALALTPCFMACFDILKTCEDYLKKQAPDREAETTALVSELSRILGEDGNRIRAKLFGSTN